MRISIPRSRATSLERLAELAAKRDKQVLIATHSTELLRASEPETILEFRARGGPSVRYLSRDHQKTAVLAGLGADYAPRLDKLRRTKRLLFLEGSTDATILRILAGKIGEPISSNWVEWTTSIGHKERKLLHRALSEEIPDLVTVSLRDRDDEPSGTVGTDLRDRSIEETAGFFCRKWRRRHIETYLLSPAAIAAASGMTVDEVEARLVEEFAVAITQENFVPSDAPDAILDLRGKAILKDGDAAILGQVDASAADVARNIDPDWVPDDIRTFLRELSTLA